MRLAWQFHENTAYGTLHLDERVPTIRDYYISETPSEEAKELKCNLENIPGVVKVTAHDYSISITKGAVFRWDEIQSRVLSIIADHFEFDVTTCKEVPPPNSKYFPL